MSIPKFIKRVCVQTAVYWGNPQNDGRGGMTFDYPVEIKCRWEIKQRMHSDDHGREFLSMSEVLLTQDVQIQGYLFLGSLTDITGYGESTLPEANPKNVEGALEVLLYDATPLFRSATKFVRTAYLGFRNV